MRDKGFTKAKLARAMKISYQSIKKVADGGSFGVDNNFKAAKLLGVSPQWLASEEGPKYPDGEMVGVLHEQGDALHARAIATNQSSELSVSDHLQAIGAVIASSDELTRAQIKPILEQLLRAPDQAEELGQRLQATIALRSSPAGFIAVNPFPKK